MSVISMTRAIRDGERGATVVFMTLVLVVLMGFAALAVDLAHKWAQRRHDQAAVDTGALAGSLFTEDRSAALAIADAEDEVFRITYSTINPSVTPAEWEAQWVACTDPDRLAITSRTRCISFTDNLQRMRVRLPNVPVDAAFGPVLGVQELPTTAAAVVLLKLHAAGDVLPFGLPSSAAGDAEVCLKSGVNPVPIEPCDGPNSGNFGYIEITNFGNESEEYQTVIDCTGDNAMMVRNIVTGVDHPLGNVPGPLPPAVEDRDRDRCNEGPPNNWNSRPYTVLSQPGTPDWVLGAGLVEGMADGPMFRDGRLADPGGASILGYPLDDKPLWEFIPGALQAAVDDIPAICERSSFFAPGSFDWDGDGVDEPNASHEHMIACIEAFATAPGNPAPLFTLDSDGDALNAEYDLQRSPRWAAVPEMWSADINNGTGPHDIRIMRPVFIQTLYACQGGSCGQFNPGETPDVAGNGNNIDAMTAILLPDRMLTADVIEVLRNPDGKIERVLVE